MKQKIFNKIENIKEEIISLSMDIYNNPEIAMEEFKTSEKLCKYLENKSFEVERSIGGMETAFKASKKNGEGPRIVFIAEYDALAYGHACGHHLICTMSLAAAIGLSEALDEYPGEICVIGTPAEEIGEGKPRLIENGVFDGYDVAMMIHPDGVTVLQPDEVNVGGYDFTFTGKTSHAGQLPYEGVNALDAIVLFYNNISVLRQQLRDGTRIHGIITNGGDVVNSIPDRCTVRYEIRHIDLNYYNEVLQKVIRCAQAASLATGCALEYNSFERTCLNLKKNTPLMKIFKTHMEEFGIYEEGSYSGGASDIGDLSHKMPVLQPLVVFSEDRSSVHTKEFLEASITDFAKERLITGSKIMALTGFDILTDKNLLNEIKEEFRSR
ncbi:MAG: M20 family metallopeptidase [Intestinibacter sp.]|uniref:M20 family metallopeptidase n=1 Tax=Intestinibacter sp. TaxID=1965304 RepID=UPI003F16B3D6